MAQTSRLTKSKNDPTHERLMPLLPYFVQRDFGSTLRKVPGGTVAGKSAPLPPAGTPWWYPSKGEVF